MATAVHELDLPSLDICGTEREDALAAFDAARQRHWLARMPFGYMVTRYADVVAILRDRRFHSALAFLPAMAGIDPDDEFMARRQQSILSMEGAEHARIRRIVAGAFTPKSADRLRPFMREVVNGLV